MERDVFCKLQDPLELAHLKVDNHFYYHVYADLYMLAKSKDLGKSVLCMNQHYLELQLYLQEVTKDPSVVFDSKYHVFSSENRLYEKEGKVNHHLKGQVVYDRLFKDLKADQDSLEPLLVRGASKMEQKLSAYAADLEVDTGMPTHKHKMCYVSFNQAMMNMSQFLDSTII